MSQEQAEPVSTVTVGRIVSAHGVRGEVKVEPLTDFPQRFARGSRLLLEGTPVTVERARPQGRTLLVKLEGVDTRDEAQRIVGRELSAAEPAPLEDGVYYLHDLIGIRVEDAAGDLLGELAEVLSTGSNDVYVVRGERGELLLPALDDVVIDVDVAARRMVVDPPEGSEFHSPSTRHSRGGRRRAERPG